MMNPLRGIIIIQKLFIILCGGRFFKYVLLLLFFFFVEDKVMAKGAGQLISVEVCWAVPWEFKSAQLI